MQNVYHTTTTEKVINDTGSLTEFYNLTNKLSKTRFVRFTGKNDEADNIEWRFTYRGHKLVLQYNIYNGVSLHTSNIKDSKAVHQLAEKLLQL
jgi:hypothetical protein